MLLLGQHDPPSEWRGDGMASFHGGGGCCWHTDGLTFKLQVLDDAFRQRMEGVPGKVGRGVEHRRLPLLQDVLQQLVQDVPCRGAKVKGYPTPARRFPPSLTGEEASPHLFVSRKTFSNGHSELTLLFSKQTRSNDTFQVKTRGKAGCPAWF